MRLSTILAITAIGLGLTACAEPDMTNWTPEQIAQRQANQAAMMQMGQALQQSAPMMAVPQTQPLPVPQVGPYGQPNSTAVVYCRDLTGSIIACKQVN